MQPPNDPRDLRDLAVLAERERGVRIDRIARAVGVTPEIVETIIAEDRAEFPDEPLDRSRTHER